MKFYPDPLARHDFLLVWLDQVSNLIESTQNVIKLDKFGLTQKIIIIFIYSQLGWTKFLVATRAQHSDLTFIFGPINSKRAGPAQQQFY